MYFFLKVLPTNCLNVFDHFVGLALKGLKKSHLISLTLISVGLTNSDSKITNFLIHILICCLNLSKEFRFLYRFGAVFHIILSLKHRASVPCRELFVLGNLSRLLFRRL